MTLFSYRLLTLALSPALRLWDAWRAYSQPAYRDCRAQRWARQLPAPVNTQLIWIHAVSVGETQACAPLLRALLLAYPNHAVLLTHMTPTGRRMGADLFAQEIAAQRVQQCYLPYDVAGLPERFLRHFEPGCGLFMETELWPNCIAACKAADIPLGLANARLSERSLHKSKRFFTIAKATFNTFSWVGAQSEMDAQRIAQLRDQPIAVTGNIKFDVSIDAPQHLLGHAFKAAQHGRPTIALASTREGEEALLLNSMVPWLNQQTIRPLVLLIPRHPKRANELLELLVKHGLTIAQRSQGQQPDEHTQVYLCDTLGEMWFYYGASDIAIVGGGWQNLGGQNLIEPCMAGCATIVGPHMFNFADATSQALASQALIQCDLPSLMGQLERLQQVSIRAELVKNAQRFVSQHAGATAKHLALIVKTMK
jgi:3-deoxy-D-manno-octulosonic-acid transferase